MNVDLAPGCYGSALTFRKEAPECKACRLASSCKEKSESSTMALRARYAIYLSDISTRPTEEKETDRIIAIIKANKINVSKALKRGNNPFEGREPHFMAVACHLLIKFDQFGVFLSRSDLASGFRSKLGWTEEKAAECALQAFQILSKIGAVTRKDGGQPETDLLSIGSSE